MSFFRHGRASLACGLLVATAGSAAAQAVHKTKPYKQMPITAVTQVHFDPGSGTYVMGPPPPAPCPGLTGGDFDNSDIFRTGPADGWLSTDTGGGVCRWFSNAAKGTAARQTANPVDLVKRVVFSYCSNALDPTLGGPGGAVTLGFYEGYTAFGGSPTTTVAVLALTGMPSDVSPGSFFSSGAGCYELHLDFPTPVAFADNQFIGYSWQFDDTGTDGTFGNTYPFLSCVVSCNGQDFVTTGSAGGIGGSPMGLGEDGQGMLDVIDQFCTSPFTASTFTFGGVPWGSETRTSINMRLEEVAQLSVPNTSYNSVPPNVDTLAATTMRIGNTWIATTTRPPTQWPGEFALRVRSVAVPGAGLNPPAFHVGRLLVTGGTLPIPAFPFLWGPSGVLNNGTGSVSVAIPADLSLVCLNWAAQARSRLTVTITFWSFTFKFKTPWRMSSAVRGTIGT